MHYHTQHAPFGAFASFTLGLPGGRGGFGQSLAGPAGQNLFIGYRHVSSEAKPSAWLLLPFFQHASTSATAAFTGETVDSAPVNSKPRMLDIAVVERQLGWASDTWRHDGFCLNIFSPFDRTTDPATMPRAEARLAFAPVVCAEIGFDNTQGTDEVELLFGLGDAGRPFRPLEDCAPDLCGFAVGSTFGFAARAGDVAGRLQAFDLFNPTIHDHRGLHLLGGECGLLFRVPAGRHLRFPLALAFYQDGVVTTGLSARYYYTKLFSALEDVLHHGLEQHAHYTGIASKRDAELTAAPLDDNQRWLVAQATHGYLGSTQLLLHRGRPLWVVNEGEYRMINTFDLTVDHLFFELTWHPWAVRSALDLFASRYRYSDSLRLADGTEVPGGVSFTHDMGVTDQFSPAGTSSYECTGLHGCFSQMTMEQLINWICCAVTYVEHTGDLAWLHRRSALLLDCAKSLRRRDHPDPAQRTGLLRHDSSRCGPGGSEITTYDSLDVSLGQARLNLYIAVKALAAWTLLERAFTRLDRGKDTAAARTSADLAAAAISARFEAATGMFPAVFENHNQSRILPAVEGLVFPLFLGFSGELSSRYPQLWSQLSSHLHHALQPGVCLDSESGAWKLSSTSANTWFSKIAIAQHIVRRLFPEADNADARRADAVHARFQQSAPLGRFAMVDQFHSATGADLGSRYYPRGVTAFLWLTA